MGQNRRMCRKTMQGISWRRVVQQQNHALYFMGTTLAQRASRRDIGPSLHHLASFVETLCAVVGNSNLVTLRVRELKFNKIGLPT